MARVKQAVQIINTMLETFEDPQQDDYIRGMIDMAERLDKLTHNEARGFRIKLYEIALAIIEERLNGYK